VSDVHATPNAMKAVLRGRGITPTVQRVAVAQVLFARPQHVSAEQLLRKVNANGRFVSKATVYNTLGLFARRGLVREVIVDPSRVFYDSNVSQHHHVFDVSTGRLTDFTDDWVSVGRPPDLPEGTVVEGVDVIVRVRSRPG
jgi:Fur family iron response transcriptional regulator